MKSQSHLVKTRPNLIACEGKERNPMSNCILMKLIHFCLRVFAVTLIAFSSLSFGSRVVKKDVGISIPKNITAVP